MEDVLKKETWKPAFGLPGPLGKTPDGNKGSEPKVSHSVIHLASGGTLL